MDKANSKATKVVSKLMNFAQLLQFGAGSSRFTSERLVLVAPVLLWSV